MQENQVCPAQGGNGMEGWHSITFNALGTVCRFAAPVWDDVLLRTVRQWVRERDDDWSVFKEDSEVSRLNRAAGRTWTPLKPDTMALLREAKECAAMTGGAFAVTSGPLTALWRQALASGIPPAEAVVRAALDLVDDADVLLRPETGEVMLRRPGQQIDLGGIAKGFAADRVRDILLEGGVTEALIDLGGTVWILGGSATVGIRHPQPGTDRIMGRFTVHDGAVVTSGTYERYVRRGDRLYHHVIDCRTGNPAQSGLCSVTLAGAPAVRLDALATAFLVTGAAAALPVLQRQGWEGVFVTDGYDVLATPGLKDNLQLLGKDDFHAT